MRHTALLLLAAACAPPQPDDLVDTDAVEVPYDPPEGVTTADHDPATRVRTFPDDLHTVPARTTTGLQVQLAPALREELGELLPEGFTLVEALEQLDGFGTTAGVTLAFSGPVDRDSLAGAVHFVRLDDGVEIPWSAWWTGEDGVVVIEPLRPLQPSESHALLLTRDLRDLDGAEVWPSEEIHRLVHGSSEAPTHVTGLWTRALEVTGLAPERVAHGTVFTTQSLWAQDEALATWLRSRGPALERGSCAPAGNVTRCEATLTLVDPLGPDGWIPPDLTAADEGTYTVPVTISLPGDGQAGPYPVLFHGHGLGGDRGESHGVARDVASEGVAVIAIDAPRHGDHPLAPTQELKQVLGFFGITIETQAMDVLVLRDDFRLGALERVQLLEALKGGFDADGDGDLDLDGSRMTYSGHSLGGVMGPQLLALAPELQGGFLSVPGGRVAAIVHRSRTFAILVAAMAPPGVDPTSVDRFFPLLQTAIERTDPLVWAAKAAEGRDLLVQQVIDDSIIPDETTMALGRALGVERVGPHLQEVPGLPDLPATLPVVANQDGHTRVYMQFDQLDDGGERVEATHTDIFGSETNQAQLRHWLRTWLDEGVSEVIDPFAD
ncbi:MAG: hypothetical protein H6732_05930 [Alphaproteobacteria bacterium]|nr:hypothetical protein [Alphaproteobacteria bacterium]